MLDKRKFYINGKWVSPSKPNDLEVINPSNEDPYAVISLGSKEDIDKAVFLNRIWPRDIKKANEVNWIIWI